MFPILTVKITSQTLSNYLRGPNFGLFCFTTSGFQDVAHFIISHWLPCKRKKSAKNPKFEISQFIIQLCSDPSYEYAWILGSKSVVYFQTRCLNFSPIWSHVNEKKKKNPKFEISPILIQVWYRPSLEVCTGFWEWWICYVLSEEMSFEVFLPYGLMLTTTKKKWLNLKTEKQCLEMRWKGTFPPNLALICTIVSEKRVLRTTDARVATAVLLCSSTKQS